MKIKKIACLVYNNFESLDLFGPIEVFGSLTEKPEIFLVSENGNPVKSLQGQSLICDYSIKDTFDFDLLCIPGGWGARTEVYNKLLTTWISNSYSKSRIIFSICTGSALLAVAGVIDYKKATSNKKAFNWVKGTNSLVHWKKKARWVQSDNIYTSSGVSAGIDAALKIVANLYGYEEALNIAISMEYIWNEDPNTDPFAAIYKNDCPTII